ncbi:MAG: type transport system permease protein [Chloroflexota bacterium]|nr:type transport system permease protein [Chloroflexota bacterium]
MKNAFLIAWREYADNARTKGFWIGLTIVPLLLWGSIQVPILLHEKATPVRYFVLVDQSGQFEKIIEAGLDRAYQRKVRQAAQEYAAKYAKSQTWRSIDLEKISLPKGREDAFGEILPNGGPGEATVPGAHSADAFLAQVRPFLKPDAPKFKAPRRDFQRLPLPLPIKANADLAALAKELKPYLRGQQKVEADGTKAELHAAILIPADIEGKIRRQTALPTVGREQGIEYWSGNLAEESLRNQIQNSINAEVRRRELQTRGLDLAAVRDAMRSAVPFVDLNPKKEEGREEVSLADRIRQWAPSGFVYLLWISVFSIIQMLLNNTIEEKSNRLIEVLLSSVTPGELMMGKLAGIGAIGLTLVGTWVLTLLGVLWWKAGPESEVASQLLAVIRTSNLLPAFLVYFALGFLMYSGLILAIGSVCNTLKDAQNYMGLITMVMMVPLLTMMFIPKDPNGPLATVLSWVPIYTPFVMLNRAAADPPLFDVVGTMILLVVTASLVLWGSGKIFRIGILRTGQPPRLLEIVRWLRRREIT